MAYFGEMLVRREFGGLLYKEMSGVRFYDFCLFFAVLRFSAKLCAVLRFQPWEAVCGFHLNLKRFWGVLSHSFAVPIVPSAKIFGLID